MNEKIGVLRSALSDTISAAPEGTISEWQNEDQCPLVETAKRLGLKARAWGFRMGNTLVGQALIDAGAGNIVIDVTQGQFFEATKPIEQPIPSATARAMMESDPQHAIKEVIPEHAKHLLDVVSSLDVQIEPLIRNYSDYGRISYSKNNLLAA